MTKEERWQYLKGMTMWLIILLIIMAIHLSPSAMAVARIFGQIVALVILAAALIGCVVLWVSAIGDVALKKKKS